MVRIHGVRLFVASIQAKLKVKPHLRSGFSLISYTLDHATSLCKYITKLKMAGVNMCGDTRASSVSTKK